MTIDDNGCDMTCRAPNGSTTCSGTQTGAQLGYNSEGQLTTWQNAPTSPSSPSSTDANLYDGEGNRVEQQVTTGLPGSPITTTTVYIGNIEEVSTASNSPTSTTTYYYAGQQRIALAVSGSFSYLATDALGSSTVPSTPPARPPEPRSPTTTKAASTMGQATASSSRSRSTARSPPLPTSPQSSEITP